MPVGTIGNQGPERDVALAGTLAVLRIVEVYRGGGRRGILYYCLFSCSYLVAEVLVRRLRHTFKEALASFWRFFSWRRHVLCEYSVLRLLMLQTIIGRRQKTQRKEGRAIRSFSRLLVARQFPNHFSTVQPSPVLVADP